MDLEPYLNLAVDAAYEAGQLTLGYFGSSSARPDFKEDDTPVTVADREAEELIRTKIRSRFPDHGLVGEEYGVEEGKSESHRWIIDPIDGTKAFVRSVPLYAVLIALEIEGSSEVGVAYFPALGEMIWAATGMGCRLNGRAVHVADTQRLSDGIVCFTTAKDFEKYNRQEEWKRVLERSGDARGWSDAYGHALVATGRADAMLDPSLKPWDGGPFPPILREAGGYFGDWSGNEGVLYADEGLSTTKLLLPEVLAVVHNESLE